MSTLLESRIAQAERALQAEIADKARKSFTPEERASAVEYRRGYLEGLKDAAIEMEGAS